MECREREREIKSEKNKRKRETERERKKVKQIRKRERQRKTHRQREREEQKERLTVYLLNFPLHGLNKLNQAPPTESPRFVLSFLILCVSLCNIFTTLDIMFLLTYYNCCRCWQIYNRRSNHYYEYVWVCMGMCGY